MQKKVLALHDLSGFGRSSLVPIIAAISAAGHQCVPLPTAYFSTHMAIPGWETVDLTGVMPRVIDQYDRLGLRFESVYAGFLGSVDQIDCVRDAVLRLKSENGTAFIDPVMGDNGKMYAALTEDYPARMRKFIEGADIITPNITEACLLTGRSFNPCPTLHETKEMLRELCGFGVRFAVITGFSEKGQLGAVGCFDGAFTECLTPKKDVACSGTGDVFASALLGAVLRGADYPQALEIATKFTYAAVEYTAAASDRRFYGIHFQPVLGEYIRMLERVEKGRSDG